MPRVLASIRRIEEIKPIDAADAIEAVRVGGWWVVAKKGEYKVDSLAVYCETDSWIPTSIAPFLTKPGQEPRVFEGVRGERLRTVKLRGQLSQGLLLPLDVIVNKIYTPKELFEQDWDVTEILGIKKYEKPIPAQLAGMVKGNFPSFIPKTDQERIQNMKRDWEDSLRFEPWEVTEKLDGSSMTVYVRRLESGFESGVCSRNLELKEDASNSFWEAARKYDLIGKLLTLNRSLALQGELVGEGIQGNSYKLTGRHFYCFDIFDIDAQRYLLPMQRLELLQELKLLGVPLISIDAKFEGLAVDELLVQAEGKSVIGAKPEREGLVFKHMKDHSKSFKVISNKWTLKYE